MPSRLKPVRCLFACAVLFGAAPVAHAASDTSGLPLPRYVSLRSDEVNLRVGPGAQYPIDWIYVRRDLPVEVINELKDWRKIRDWQGTEGWVHQSMLSPKRMLVVTGAQRRLRADPDEKSPSIALIDPNVAGRLVSCPRDKAYCKVAFENYQGWMRRDEFWGVYAKEYIE